jgi:hypothetical protein
MATKRWPVVTLGAELAMGRPERAQTRAHTTAKSAPSAYWPAAAILALAVWLQTIGPLQSDVSWLITLSEKVLNGERPYLDFLEVNPPASIALYLTPVGVARFVGITPEFMVGLFCFLAVAGCLFLCRLALRGQDDQHAAPLALAGALAVLALFPAHVFAQREHIALLAGLPFFAVLAARANGKQSDMRLRLLAGLGAGVMISIKPHLALAIVAPLPYFAWRVGLKALVSSIELYAAAFFGALYVAFVILFFPAFIERIAPIVMAVYAPVGESRFAMLGGESFIAWLVLTVYLLVFSRDRLGDPFIAIPALASFGAMLAFLVQGKEWPYQAYPAVALMVLALGSTMLRAKSATSEVVVSLICFAGIVLTAREEPTSLPYLPYAAVAICGLFVAARTFAEGSLRWRAPTDWLAAPAVASAVAFAFVWFSHQNEPPPLQAAAAALGPHPKVLTISQDLGVGHPFTRQIGGVWAQRVPSLWITSGARRLLEDSKDPADRAKLESYLRLDRDMLVEDIDRNRPDIILISNRFGEFHHWAFADPAIAAALANYKLYATDGEAKGETFLYARADLIPLRPALADAPVPGPTGPR